MAWYSGKQVRKNSWHTLADFKNRTEHRHIESNEDCKRWYCGGAKACDRESWLLDFENIMTTLVGTWTCGTGSIHHVFPDGHSKSSFAIKTIREDGKERLTKALFKRGSKCNHDTVGRIQWGQSYELQPFQGRTETVTWQPRNINSISHPLVWTRVVDDTDESTRESERTRRRSVSSQGNGTSSGRDCSDSSFTRTSLRRWSDESSEIRDDMHQRQRPRRVKGRRSSNECSHEDDHWMSMQAANDSTLPESDHSCERQLSLIQSSKRKAPSARTSWSSLRPENFSTFSMRQEKIEVEEATLRVREATLTIQEASAAQLSLDAARRERATLAAEVEALTRKRIAEQQVVEDCKHEEEKMRAKLMRCREVVAVTVNSIDVMMGSGGNDELLKAVEIAQAAAAEADEMIGFLDSETTDADSRGRRQVRDLKEETSESSARSWQ